MNNGTTEKYPPHSTPDTAKDRMRNMAEEAGLDPQFPRNGSGKQDSATTPYLTIVDAVSLIKNPPPKPPVLIEGILDKGDKLVLGGASKTKKTWSSLDLAISVATGTPWWGFDTKQGKVLYLNFELQPYSIAARLSWVRKAKKVNLDEGWFHLSNLRGSACDGAAFVDQVLKELEAKDYDLIMIDPIYKCLGGRNENDAGEVAGLCNAFEKLAVKTGAAVILVAHFSKGNQSGKSPIDRIVGSGVWGRDGDSILTVTEHDQDGAFTVDATIRNHVEPDSFVIRWQKPLMVRDASLDPGKLRKAKGRGKVYDDDDIVNVLPPAGLTYTEWFKAARAKTKVGETTFKDRKNKLVAAGEVLFLKGKYVHWVKVPPVN
jgi:hypothetical protein